MSYPKNEVSNQQLSVTELATQLKISRTAVLKKIRQGKLPQGYTAIMVGNQYVITKT